MFYNIYIRTVLGDPKFIPVINQKQLDKFIDDYDWGRTEIFINSATYYIGKPAVVRIYSITYLSSGSARDEIKRYMEKLKRIEYKGKWTLDLLRQMGPEITYELLEDRPWGNKISTAAAEMIKDLKAVTEVTKNEFRNMDTKEKEANCIFIGHGRSKLYAVVDNFLTKKLKLETETFESQSRVGKSIVNELEGMLDRATFAIIILTAEDETGTGTLRARQNVIHEAGLFQGRLGFSKVVIMRQDDVEKFTNIDGLQYISFTGDQIDKTFHELREVLEREGIIT